MGKPKFKFDYDNTFAWYAIHTKSGREEAVKESIEKLKETRHLDEFVDELFIPYETVEETRNNKTVEKKKKIYSTYLFGKIKMTDDVWYIIRNTRDVYGFIGSAGHRGKPTPFKDSDIEALKIRCGIPVQINLDFCVGDNVLILDGPFKDRIGKVDSINSTEASVLLDMFGRETPVNIDVVSLQKNVD